MKRNTIISFVKEGDRIPFDGKVTEGFALVDESAHTGVSTPAMLEAADGRDNALAGTLVIEGRLKIESPLDARMKQPDSVYEAAAAKSNRDRLNVAIKAVVIMLLMAAATYLVLFTKHVS